MVQTYCHSPFSEETAGQGTNPAILLQFILNELMQAGDFLIETPSPFSSPFDWTEKAGSYNKVKEHAQLLHFAFPSLTKEIELFQNSLSSSCYTLISLLEPFILAAKENVYLLYFLMKHKNHPAILNLINKLPKENIAKMQSVIATKYRKKRLSPPEWIY